jgi:hypothetical protein
VLGKADLKRLRTQLTDEFPEFKKKFLDKVLPKDAEVNLLKCSNGTQLYVPGDGPPAFFDDGFGGVYPTLFTLWKLPPIMPELVTHGPVSKFLLPKERSAGADMMCVLSPSNQHPSPHTASVDMTCVGLRHSCARASLPHGSSPCGHPCRRVGGVGTESVRAATQVARRDCARRRTWLLC